MSARHQKKISNKTKVPSKLLIQLANQYENPLEILLEYDSMEHCLHSKISDFETKTQCFTWLKLSNELQQWMIDLTEQNMKDLYESSSWKWNRQSKLSELKHTTSRHLIVFNVNSNIQQTPIAFVHFRFEEGYNSDATLYCYELQVETSYQRLGIGRYLMDLLQTLATKHRMKKVVLTVLKKNYKAFKFYINGLQFKIDKNSPSCFKQQTDYEILSKNTDMLNINEIN